MKNKLKSFWQMLLLLAFVPFLIGGGGSSGTGGEGRGLRTIASGILLGASQLPIAGALVSFAGTGAQAVTDARGQFQVESKQPPDESVTLQVKMKDSQYTVPVKGARSGEHVKVDMIFDADKNVINVDSFVILEKNLEELGRSLDAMGDQLDGMAEQLDQLGTQLGNLPQ